MPNANILFQNQPTPSLGANFRDALGTQEAFNQFQQQPMRNRLLDAQVQGAEIGNQSQLMNQQAVQQDQARKDAIFKAKDMAMDALQIKPLIQSGDTAATLQALEMRANKIKQRGGDPSDTIDFMQRIMGGQLSGEQAIQELDSVVDGAVRAGAIDPESAGSEMTPYQKEALSLQKQRLDQTANAPTSNQRDMAEYQRLLKEDPAAAKIFGQGAGLLNKDRPLSSTAEKALIDAQDAYFSSSTQSREYELLAGDYERFKGSLPEGVAGTFSEFLKSVAGSQDDASELRRRFAKVRLSEALKYLPPGPATDRDVEEAFKGVPKENASTEQVKMFLRGSAKMARIDAEYQSFKADYISENDNSKGLITAWKEAVKNGEIESIESLKAQEPQADINDLVSKYAD